MSEPEETFNRVSLNEQVTMRLLKSIRSNNKVGDRLPAEVALSKQLGVSVITLRESLSVLAHRGFIERRHGSGTYVLDPAATQQIAVATSLDLSDPNLSYFHRRVTYLVRNLLEKAGFKSRIYSGSFIGSPMPTNQKEIWPPEALLKDIKMDLIRAVIALPSSPLTPFGNPSFPIISTSTEAAYSVTLPSAAFYSAISAAMAKKNCRTAAILDWKRKDLSWQKPFAAAGLTTRPEWVAEADYSIENDGWRAFRSLWHAYEEKPDCVIVADDVLFRDISLAILSERINVPEDLKVATYYNKGSRIIIPWPCTTFTVDPEEFAKELVGLCTLALSENCPSSKHIQMPFEISEHTVSEDLRISR